MCKGRGEEFHVYEVFICYNVVVALDDCEEYEGEGGLGGTP